MKLTVTETAVAYFKRDWNAREGDNVRIFVRYGAGISPQGSFSLGIVKEPPQAIGASNVNEGILFFVNESDAWFFDGKDLTVDYDAELDELLTVPL